jgi:hypothetical protein
LVVIAIIAILASFLLPWTCLAGGPHDDLHGPEVGEILINLS